MVFSDLRSPLKCFIRDDERSSDSCIVADDYFLFFFQGKLKLFRLRMTFSRFDF